MIGSQCREGMEQGERAGKRVKDREGTGREIE